MPALINGGTDEDGLAFLDLDDTVREVHGYAKQAAAYGYSKVFGLKAMFATVSTPLAAPVIVAGSLRNGNTGSGSGSGSSRMLARAVTTARRAGVRSRLMGRADAAFYRHDLVKTMIRNSMWFSVRPG